jgi:uncharacterized membrane protein
MPPLHYALLHGWLRLAGEAVPGPGAVAWGRGYALLLAAPAFPLLFLLARRLAGERDAVAAVGLFAVSPLHVFYGHYVRMYGLMLVAGLAAAFWFLRWLDDGRRRDLAAFTGAAAVSLYVHPLAVLLIATLDLVFMVRVGRAEFVRRFPALAVAHLVLALAYTPWLVYLPGQIEKVARAFWIPEPGLSELVRTVIMFHFHLPLPGWALAPAGFLAMLLAVVTAIEAHRRWRAWPVERPALAAAGLLVVAPVALMFVVSQVRPVYVERAVLLSGAVYFALLAAALRRLPVRPLAGALYALLAAGLVLANLYQYHYEAFPRSPFYAVTAVVEAELRPGDLVLHDNKLSYFPSHVIAPGLPQGYLADPPGSPNDTLAPASSAAMGLEPLPLSGAAAHPGRVWLVVFERALRESATTGSPLAGRAALAPRGAPEERRVGDLVIYRYPARN